MTLKFYQETTKWPGTTPNHTYLLNKDKSKMLAYVPAGSRAVFKFKNPLRIDTRGRTFQAIEENFGYTIDTVVNTNPQWQVKGSQGDVYTVEQTENGFTCTCSGFRFRSTCKHTKELENGIKTAT